MVWGGSLNEKGSNYIRKLKEAEKVVKFLEEVKKDLNSREKEILKRAIEILIKLFTKNSNEEI